MKNILFITILICFLFGSNGDAGQEIAILEVGAGAKAFALGSAYVAHAPDATSLYWNPAALAFLKNNEISTMQNKLATEASYYYMGGAFPNGQDFTWGINWMQIELPDLQETAATLNNNEVQILNTFTYQASTIILGAGKKFSEHFALGINGKYIYKKLSEGYGESKGQSFAIGLYYLINESITFGLLADNIGNIQKYDTGLKEIVPVKYTAGFQFKINSQLGLALDVEKRSDRNSLAKGHGGIEYKFNDHMHFAIGYDYQTFTAGAGFSINNVYADYAYRADNSYNLGAEHFVTLGVRW